MDTLLTVEEMSNILHISKNTIQSRRWKDKSGCPLIKKGKRIYSINSRFWDWFKEGGK